MWFDVFESDDNNPDGQVQIETPDDELDEDEIISVLISDGYLSGNVEDFECEMGEGDDARIIVDVFEAPDSDDDQECDPVLSLVECDDPQDNDQDEDVIDAEFS